MNSLFVTFAALIVGAFLGAGALYEEVLKPQQDKAEADAEALRAEVKQAKDEARTATERARENASAALDKAQLAATAALADAKKKNEAMARELDEEKKKEAAATAKLAEVSASKPGGTMAAPTATVTAEAEKPAVAPVNPIPTGPTLDELKRSLATAQAALDAAKKGRSDWEDSFSKNPGRGGTMPDEFSAKRIRELQEYVDNLQFKIDSYGK